MSLIILLAYVVLPFFIIADKRGIITDETAPIISIGNVMIGKVIPLNLPKSPRDIS